MHRQVSFSLVSQAGIAFFVALIMAVRGYQRKSLSVSGAIAALVVGTLSLGMGQGAVTALMEHFH